VEELNMSDQSQQFVPEPPRHVEPRRLRRSRRDRMVGGVCGGIARYLDVDPVLLRIATVALVLSGGVGLLVYVVAWIVIPAADAGEPDRTAPPPTNRQSAAIAVGAFLVGLGVLLLARHGMPGMGAGMFWPLVVVAAGVFFLVSAPR
jgi:phage shock protein C